MLNLAIPRDLVSISIIDSHDRVYKLCSLDDAKHWRKEKRDFTLLDGSLVASHQITRIEKATALEEFELFVFPQLNTTARQDFMDIKNQALSLKKNPSLTAILGVIEARKSSRHYELMVNRTISGEELERRRQQVASRPRIQIS